MLDEWARRAARTRTRHDVVVASALLFQNPTRGTGVALAHRKVLMRLLRATPPGDSLEYRRLFYLARDDMDLINVYFYDRGTDPLARLRRVLCDTYPNDVRVWYEAYSEGGLYRNDLAWNRRNAVWWATYPRAGQELLSPLDAARARFESRRSLIYLTRSSKDVAEAERLFLLWRPIRLATPSVSEARQSVFAARRALDHARRAAGFAAKK